MRNEIRQLIKNFLLLDDEDTDCIMDELDKARSDIAMLRESDSDITGDASQAIIDKILEYLSI